MSDFRLSVEAMIPALRRYARALAPALEAQLCFAGKQPRQRPRRGPDLARQRFGVMLAGRMGQHDLRRAPAARLLRQWHECRGILGVLQLEEGVPETVAACFELIESKMLQGPWVMGETYTICDPYLFTLARWMEGDSVDPARFPKVKAHRDRMAERPAVSNVLAAEKG